MRTPIRQNQERRSLTVNLNVGPDGRAQGGAGLLLTGWSATGFIEQIAAADPARTEEDARAIFSHLLPGVEILRLGWEVREGDVPSVSMSASVTVGSLVQGLGQRPSLRLTSLRATPEPRELDEDEGAVVLSPGVTEATWYLKLPEPWCRPRPDEKRLDNAVGVFEQRVAYGESAHSVKIERRVELQKRWIEPDEVPALAELALAEHRAHRRRIRLVCEE